MCMYGSKIWTVFTVTYIYEDICSNSEYGSLSVGFMVGWDGMGLDERIYVHRGQDGWVEGCISSISFSDFDGFVIIIL